MFCLQFCIAPCLGGGMALDGKGKNVCFLTSKPDSKARSSKLCYIITKFKIFLQVNENDVTADYYINSRQ